MQKGIQSLRCARGSSGVVLNQLCQGVVFRQEMTSQQRRSWFFEAFTPFWERLITRPRFLAMGRFTNRGRDFVLRDD